MMSKKQLACMLALHIVYLLVGASIFYHIESPLELQQRDDEKLERLEIQNLLYENYIPNDPDKQDSILKKLSEYCGKPMFNATTDDQEPPYKWDFYHSFFFSYTVVSTIGYGNLAPTTHLSRILMIFYGLFGIPINGILLANLGEYFGVQLISVYRKYKKRHRKRANNMNYFFTNLGMLGQIFLYLVPGFLFFIFLPACIFVIFEGWDYVASVYYAFVTLTTIGFGDLVAGTVNNGFKSGYFFTYQIFLIVWITFGLGYIVMLLGFITSGMRSESVHRIEQKIANQFKSTQNRLLQGFSRDINVIRKLINEANLIKIKPIYVDAAPSMYKSASCPNFTFDIEPRGPIVGRKRANSENIHLSAKDLLRIQSDTDLLGIDKEKTFSAQAIVKPAELLARVVNVLGGMEPQQQQEKGVHMFDDDQILASEKPPIFSIGHDVIPSSPSAKRNRALSVAVPNYRKESVSQFDHDFTWTNGDSAEKYRKEANIRSGKLSLPNNFIPPEEIEAHNRGALLTNLFKNNAMTDNPAELIKNNMKDRVSQAQEVTENVAEKPKRRGSIFTTFGFGGGDKRKEDDDISKAYKEKTQRGRKSIFPSFDFSEEEEDTAAIKAYQQKKRHSIFPTFDFSESDDDDVAVARTYKEKTKTGRRSIFPTFDLNFSDDEDDDTIDDEELQRYQKRTQKGRMSLFPTFGKNKKQDEESVVPESSDEVESYKNKTKKGRLSLFPKFGKEKERKDSSANEEVSDLEASIRQFQKQAGMPERSDSDELENYKNKTRKGRLSLFPTFGKDKGRKDSSADDEVSDLEASIRQFQKRAGMPERSDSDELENYKNRTKKGRLSLFPTFGKDKERKNSSADDEVDDEASIRRCQIQTLKGHASLFPGDEDEKFDLDLERYRNKTKRGRGSLFDPDVNIAELPQREQVEVLEQTSVADLLRALAVLETTGQGQAGSAAVGLLDILGHAAPTPVAPPPGRRRGSLRPADFVLPPIPSRIEKSASKQESTPTNLEDSPKLEPTTSQSGEESAGPRKRRVSGRSSAAQFTPTLATVVAGSELQIPTAASSRENRMSMLQQPPPPYSETVVEAPEAPKVRRYSPAPMDHSRPSTGPVPRLFSRMRKENSTGGEEGNSRRGSLTDIVIDNGKDQT